MLLIQYVLHLLRFMKYQILSESINTSIFNTNAFFSDIHKFFISISYNCYNRVSKYEAFYLSDELFLIDYILI